MPLALDQSLRAAKPSACRAHLAPKREVHAEPESATHRAERLAGVQVRVVGTLQERGSNSSMRPTMEADNREQIEVVGSQGRRLIDVGQGGVGI